MALLQCAVGLAVTVAPSAAALMVGHGIYTDGDQTARSTPTGLTTMWAARSLCFLLSVCCSFWGRAVCRDFLLAPIMQAVSLDMIHFLCFAVFSFVDHRHLQ